MTWLEFFRTFLQWLRIHNDSEYTLHCPVLIKTVYFCQIYWRIRKNITNWKRRLCFLLSYFNIYPTCNICQIQNLTLFFKYTDRDWWGLVHCWDSIHNHCLPPLSLPHHCLSHIHNYPSAMSRDLSDIMNIWKLEKIFNFLFLPSHSPTVNKQLIGGLVHNFKILEVDRYKDLRSWKWTGYTYLRYKKWTGTWIWDTRSGPGTQFWDPTITREFGVFLLFANFQWSEWCYIIFIVYISGDFILY